MIFRNIRNVVRIAIVFAMVSGLLAGCQEKPAQTAQPPQPGGSDQIAAAGDQADQVKETIMRYNQLLIMGYATMNMNGLAQAADVDQATKVYFHMAAMGEGGVKILSKLKNIRFETIAFPDEFSAEVKTTEIWDFSHINIKDASVVKEEKDFPYRLDYQLEKHEGRWLVTSVTSDEDPSKDNPDTPLERTTERQKQD